MVDDVRKRPDDELNFNEGTEEVRCVAESAGFHLIAFARPSYCGTPLDVR